MSVKKACAADLGEYGCASGMKWQYLLNLSTTVSITDLPRTQGSALSLQFVLVRRRIPVRSHSHRKGAWFEDDAVIPTAHRWQPRRLGKDVGEGVK
jgi:hypothetical protein